MSNNQPQETGRECMHITYSVSKDKKSDALFVKEYTHYDDGSVVPQLRMIENMERSFWITKKGRRDHKDKLQWEDINDCDEYRCREIDLLRRADLALGGAGFVNRKAQVFSSPYLYGCGVKPQCIVKYAYAKKYPNTKSNLARVGYMDTETEEVVGTKEILMKSFTYKDRAVIAIDRRFFNNMPDDEVISRLRLKYEELMGDIIRERNMTIEILLVNNAGEIVNEVMKRAHAWGPDFVGFWNMDFDINKMIQACDKYGFSREDVFSDPSVPPKYRFFKYTEGKSVKVTHDGTTSSINPEQRWHVVECPASFFFIDGMTLYYRVRMAAGMEDGYSFDAVLERNLGLSKLKIDAISHLSGLDWHKVMQTDYKFEYCVYNTMDCVRGEQLDEHTGDIAVKLPATCKYSDFTNFKSGPTRIADEMHFHCLENGRVLGVVDGDARDDNDAFILRSVDWIITLPAYMGHTDLGLDFVEIE